MRFKSSLFFLSAVVALSAQLPDFKPVVPIHEIHSYVLDTLSSTYKKYRTERYSYTDANLIETVNEYTVDKAGDEDLFLLKRFVYDGEQLDSLINNRGGKISYLYSGDQNYDGYYSYSSPNSGQSGSSTTDKILASNAVGKPSKKLVVNRSWGRYTSSTDSLVTEISYNEKGNPTSEFGRLKKVTGRIGGPDTETLYFQKVIYQYDGDLLLKKSLLRCDDEVLSDSSSFYETEYTTYMQLTGLSSEDVSVEEFYIINDTTPKLERRTTISRNEQGVVVDSLNEVWVDSLGEMVEKSKYSFHYSEESGLLKEVVSFIYNGESVSKYRNEYLYKNETAIAENVVGASTEMNVVSKNSLLTFNMSSPGTVSLNVYSVDGRKVMTLFNGRNLEQGNYTLDLKPIAQFRGVASGVYIYQLSALGKQFSGKVAIQ